MTGGHQVETTSFRGILTPDPGWNYRPGLHAPRPAGPPGSLGGAGWIDSLGGPDAAAFLPATAAAGRTWRDYQRPRWPDVPAVPAATQLVAAAATRRDKKRVLVERLRQEGFEPALVRRTDRKRDLYLARIETPGDLDDLVVSYQGIRHVVDHHVDEARERLADYVLPTIRRPSEVWLTLVEPDKRAMYRRVFLGRFEDGRGIVVVDHWDGRDSWIFWTLYEADAENLLDDMSRFRHGLLLHP